MTEYDAVVVGAGPNGLSGAITLARAGRKVLLLEAADRVGGALRTEELTLPGFRHDVGATVMPMAVASEAFRDLRPDRHGMSWVHPEIPIGHPLDHGTAAFVRSSVAETAASLGRDGRAWNAVVGAAARAGTPLVDTLLSPFNLPRAPFSAIRYGIAGLTPATLFSRSVFREESTRALFAGIAAHSVLDLKQLITSGYGILMAALAHTSGWPLVQGGSERLAEALARQFTSLGGEIVTRQAVRSLADVPAAPVVLLNLTPRQVLPIAGDQLPARYRAQLQRFRYGPGVFKLDWALDGPVPWADPGIAKAGTVHLGASLAEITASERDTVQGRLAERPYVLAVQPTAADPSRAPEGKHVLWAYAHVPNGCQVDRTAAIEAQIERFAPGFRELILERHAMPPKALEAFDANLIGGHVGGGDADLRQFVARPVISLRPWATPVKGLYLCSSSTPPGGAVHGMGGYRAAKLALSQT